MKTLALAIALVGATVYTGEGPPLRGATIVIDGTRVHAVGTKVRPPEGAKVIDVSGRIITPGLVGWHARGRRHRARAHQRRGHAPPDADPGALRARRHP
jgi:imidazolonepropionase-like amidohydrolase